MKTPATSCLCQSIVIASVACSGSSLSTGPGETGKVGAIGSQEMATLEVQPMVVAIVLAATTAGTVSLQASSGSLTAASVTITTAAP
jgi:hypothetical protein